MNDSIDKLTDKELEKQLITLDYGGKEFKQRCLDELLSRAYLRGLEDSSASRNL